jgi:hypothetical protein
VKTKLSTEAQSTTEAASKYVKAKVIDYILNRILPEEKRSVHFYYAPEEFLALENFKILKEERDKPRATTLYERIKLSLPAANSQGGSSLIRGARKFFSYIATKKFLYNEFKDQFISTFQKDGKNIFTTVLPLVIGYFVASTAIAYLPLVIAGTAVALVIKSLFHSYSSYKEKSKKSTDKILGSFSLERELLLEQERCKDFENRSGISELISKFLEKDTIIILKDNLESPLRWQLEKLVSTIQDNPKVSRLSKEIIKAMSDLNTPYHEKWKKELKKVIEKPQKKNTTDLEEEAKYKVAQESGLRIDIYRAITNINSYLKEEKALETPNTKTLEQKTSAQKSSSKDARNDVEAKKTKQQNRNLKSTKVAEVYEGLPAAPVTKARKVKLSVDSRHNVHRSHSKDNTR